MTSRALVQARRAAVGFGFSARTCMSLLGGGSAASLGEDRSAEGLHSPHTAKARTQYLQALPMPLQLQLRLGV